MTRHFSVLAVMISGIVGAKSTNLSYISRRTSNYRTEEERGLTGGEMKLTLYRGVAIEPAAVNDTIRAIRRYGLLGNEGTWKFNIPNMDEVRHRIPEILASEKPSINDIFSETPLTGICACGDETGGRYYALKHNTSKDKTASILVTLEVDIADIYIDCRDFLCSAFQFWDRKKKSPSEKQTVTLAELFGQDIIPYFERCQSTSDQDIRVAMCNLASFDTMVVKEHYQNKRVIGGRHGTRFCSAFFVKTPILSSCIRECKHIVGPFAEPEVYIDVYGFHNLV